ncbi:MAG: sigma 54-interacting transcriptional regulator [Desulfobacterales bacterium]|nr:sigma 54-interacting transcriptional regulator [Desulfobacterales bacterium]
MDENEFFREATLRICGSIQIESALSDCFNYLKRSIDADSIYLHYITPNEKSGTVFAMADHGGGRRMDLRFSHPDVVWRYIGTGEKLPKELLLNRADQHPLGKEMVRIVGLRGKISCMILRLSIDGNEMGVVGLAARGWNRFTKEHLDLVRLLQAPFAIAISNSRRYLELLELKNLLTDDNRYLLNELRIQQNDEIVGADNGLSQVMQQVRQVAPLESPVLLLGETGAGKEVIANAVHNFSNRGNGPFIKVNCGAIPEALIDSELFGHVKGAFTGALEKRRGRFERSHRGTIFLDEIGELPKAAQLRLLRVLQEKEFEPVGGTDSIRVDIRVVAATNRNLEAQVRKGRFRKDLYFRLRVFPIVIPPLRERKGDIPALVNYFLLKKYRKMGFENFPELAIGALRKLTVYDWPGNIRELENTVERAMIISRDAPLRFDDLGALRLDGPAEEQSASDGGSLVMDDVLIRHIQKVLALTRGKISGPDGAAERLGINPATLRHRMRKLGIAFGRRVKHP